jgi:hypothetical protein
MAADAAGNLTLTGTGYATFDNNAVSVNPGGIFVAHCTTDGVFDWAVGSSAGTAAAIAIDANGDAVVTGSFPVGGATFGSETLTSAGGRDIFLVKVEGTTGAWLGAIGAGGPGTDEGKAIALAPSGDVVVAANVQGTTSLGAALSQVMMVAHADGGLSGWQGAWSVGSTVARPTAISIGAGGEEILAFSANQAPAFLGTPLPWQGGFDGYLGATGGATPWSFDVGGVANDSIYAVRALGTGNAIVVGATASPSVALGPLTLSNSGPGAMAFVARLGSPLGLAAGLGTQAFQIWPNPASQVVNLRLPTATPPVSAVELLDGLGRIVRTQSVTTTATTFNLRGVPAGVYTLRSGSLAQRLVVQVP